MSRTVEQIRQEVENHIRATYPNAAIQQAVLGSYSNSPAASTAEYWEAILNTMKGNVPAQNSPPSVEGEQGDYRYKITENEVTILEYNGGGGEVSIPSSIDGKPVTRIGSRAFRLKEITGVVIPDSVVCIEYEAFSKNQLTSVVIPDNVKQIEEIAFEENKLTEITIGKGLTVIERRTFSDNELESAEIPDNITCIGESAFSDNPLAELKFGSGLKKIEEDAFFNHKLSSVELPDGLEEVGKRAFDGNNKNLAFTSVTIPDSLTTIGEKAFGPAGAVKKDGNVEVEGKADKNFTIEKTQDGEAVITGGRIEGPIPTVISGLTIVGIAAGAFKNGTSWSRITIPDSVTFIGDEAFADNKCIKTIEFGKNITKIGKRAFAENIIKTVVIPDGVSKIEDEAFMGNHISSLTIGSGVTSIGKRAFYRNQYLANVEIPQNVKEIGEEAFARGIVSNISLPEGASVGNDAFSQNESMEGDFKVCYSGDGRAITVMKYEGNKKELTIPSFIRGLPVTKIEWPVFTQNRVVTSVILPDSVKEIGGSGGMIVSRSKDAEKLTKIRIGANVTIDDNNFDRIADESGNKAKDYVNFNEIYEKNGKKACLFTLTAEEVFVKKEDKFFGQVFSGNIKLVRWNFTPQA